MASWKQVIYKLLSCPTNIPRGLLVGKPAEIVVYCFLYNEISQSRRS